jgi:4-hydroxybenzoate polyprenyltransferase
MTLLFAALRQLRPKQWAKNVFLFVALIFSRSFFDPDAILQVLVGFAAFCMVSSTGYVLNDLLDREADRLHPKKRFRPIASGALPVPAAIALLLTTGTIGLCLAFCVGPYFLGVTLAYFCTTLSYSWYFKHVVILDIMFLASGFVWRAVAGAVAIGVAVSPWLFVCTAFLALFLGFNKRRGELLSLGDSAGTRKNLADYSPAMLEQFQAIVTGNVVLSYSLYTILSDTTNPWMAITIPYVLYGVFRYVYLIDKEGAGDAPDETLLSDRPILITAVLYTLTAVAVLVWIPGA